MPYVFLLARLSTKMYQVFSLNSNLRFDLVLLLFHGIRGIGVKCVLKYRCKACSKPMLAVVNLVTQYFAVVLFFPELMVISKS